MYVLNIKNKLYFSISDSMPVISAIFFAKEDLRSKPVIWSKTFPQNIDND
jgi:hypothetical protein